MDTADFWSLIERSAAATDDPVDRLDWLTDELSRLPVDEIIDFDVRLDEQRERADTWLMWAAALQICDGLCSDDGFWYFQLWLVGLGRQAFDLVVADPDALATVPAVQALVTADIGERTTQWADGAWPSLEGLDDVAAQAYRRVTGCADDDEGFFELVEERGHGGGSSPDPADVDWNHEDPAECVRWLPRVSATFPLSARSVREERSRQAMAELLAESGQTEDEFFAEVFGARPDQRS
ncbi:DUF4240 domain-containing protein [Catellatospora aurea]|uniref:DUF4240 domain-containing protein n=1 Tax=Catellatospora aurea TaxID=1337874 RepID=A0ABW2GMY8_9ACTN